MHCTAGGVSPDLFVEMMVAVTPLSYRIPAEEVVHDNLASGMLFLWEKSFISS